MAVVAMLVSLLGCASRVDYDVIRADLESRLVQIENVEVVRAHWSSSGLEQAVRVELRLTRDDEELAEDVARTAMDAITATALATDNASATGLIEIWIRGTDGTIMLSAEDIGLPRTLGALLKDR